MGLLDVLSAARFRYNLIGLAFTLAGIILLTGGAVLIREPWRRKSGRVAAVAAGVAGVLVGGYLLLMQHRGPGYAPSRLPPFPAWAPWAGIVAASVAGAILGWWSTKDHAEQRVTWTALGRRLIAGGFSVTVLFSGVQWWYTQQYQMGASTAAVLTVTTELNPAPISTAADASDTSGSHVLEGTIKVRNVSDTKVVIVASLYQVARVTHAPRAEFSGINEVDRERQAMACFFEELAPVTDPECEESHIYQYGQFSAEDPRSRDNYPISRYGQPIAIRILQLGPVVGDGSWLEPEEAIQHNVLVHVPTELAETDQPGYLRTFELSARLTVAQGSRLDLERVPSHGPEMVPQALMSNEEYRDYKEAEEAVQRDERQDPASVDDTTTEAESTVEVEIGRRNAYYEELTMPRSSDEARPLAATEAARSPRPYPHRYTVVEWPIEALSTLHRLVWGSHVVNTVQVLSMRWYNPAESVPLTEVERSGMVTCISPAGTLEGQAEDAEIRRDPTAVCPGMWYSLADGEGNVANPYERRYQELAEYREDMADFYGLIQTGSADAVPLTTVEEAAKFVVPASQDFHPLPSDVFQQCEPALEFAKELTDFYDIEIQSAFERHVAEISGSSPEGTSGAPTLQQGADSAEVFDAYFEGANRALLACSDIEAPEDTPAAFCPKAAAAKIDALRYAQDLGRALREAEPTDGWLQRGRDAVQAYQRAEELVDPWLAECR